jgi:hypothetical protein
MKMDAAIAAEGWEVELLSYTELLLLREALLRALRGLPLGSASSALIGAQTRAVREELRRRAVQRS